MPIFSDSLAVVALAAAVLIAYAVYRRALNRRFTERNMHDLSAELRAEQESLRAIIEALPAQIELAKRYRRAPALDHDTSEVELLRSQLSAIDSGDMSLSDVDMEIKLVEVLALSLRASALAEKYGASIPERETDLETFAEDAHATFTEDAAALRREASQYSANDDSRSPIVESVV